MNDLEERYDLQTAAAWILGHARRTGIPDLTLTVLQKTADECTEEELLQIAAAGQEAELKLYPFKSGTQMLARTRRTLGFLRSISFDTMLDVGSLFSQIRTDSAQTEGIFFIRFRRVLAPEGCHSQYTSRSGTSKRNVRYIPFRI